MIRILQGHCLDRLRELPDESVQCCVTSPPYWGLRDYGIPSVDWAGCSFLPMSGLPKVSVPAETSAHGSEGDLLAYVAHEVQIFREVRRVLKSDGVLWSNLGDAYSGAGYSNNDLGGAATREQGGKQKHTTTPVPTKNLLGLPWRVAFALQADGWTLRQDIIWHKPNPMPESVTDRCTKAHEYLFLFSKSERYYWNQEAVAERSVTPGDHRALRTDTRKEDEPFCRDNGSRMRTGNPTGETRNPRSVWSITSEPLKAAHFACFPTALPRRCILASTRPGDTVLDPFAGSGTTGMVAHELARHAILIEASHEYVELIRQRTNVTPGLPLA